MKRFEDLVELVKNNEYCVLLKVKDDSMMDLIKLGCFGGDEEMIRVAKDSDDTITIYTKDGKHYSWARGTLCVESMWQKRRMIMAYVRTKGWGW